MQLRKALHKACPIKIQKLLTDNGKEFTDRLFASREREPSGQHEFDQLCQALGIEHRLTKAAAVCGFIFCFFGTALALCGHPFGLAVQLVQRMQIGFGRGDDDVGIGTDTIDDTAAVL